MKTIYKTFGQWSNEGYLIIKGSKGTKIKGYWQFSNKQVKRKSFPRDLIKTANGNYNKFWGDSFDGHWDSADDLNTCSGPMFGIYGNC